MPELPEVQTIISDLSQKILDKRIVDVDIKQKRVVRGDVGGICGRKFTAVSRRGKYIFLEMDNERYLLIHLRMTGQLVYFDKGVVISGGHSEADVNPSERFKYVHVVIVFCDGARLYYNDQRQFGYLRVIERRDLEKISGKLGPEPLSREFDKDNFNKTIAGKKTSIKSFLLDQRRIAGIGNIYADEILFRAGVRPGRRVNTLKKSEKERIFSHIKGILKEAIQKRGTTFNTYVDANGNKGDFVRMLNVYQREGRKCRRCGTEIKKEKIAGRASRYCPKCQN